MALSGRIRLFRLPGTPPISACEHRSRSRRVMGVCHRAGRWTRNRDGSKDQRCDPTRVTPRHRTSRFWKPLSRGTSPQKSDFVDSAVAAVATGVPMGTSPWESGARAVTAARPLCDTATAQRRLPSRLAALALSFPDRGCFVGPAQYAPRAAAWVSPPIPGDRRRLAHLARPALCQRDARNANACGPGRHLPAANSRRRQLHKAETGRNQQPSALVDQHVTHLRWLVGQ